MSALLEKFNQSMSKTKIPQVRSGDSVRVHQRIVEGSKERVQVFEGVVIRTDRMGSSTAAITVRRLSSGVGVEKGFMLHAPNVEKVEVMRRSKVRRNYLSYMRERSGKSARLRELGFDPDDVYGGPEPEEEKKAAPEEKPSKEKEATDSEAETDKVVKEADKKQEEPEKAEKAEDAPKSKDKEAESKDSTDDSNDSKEDSSDK